MAKRSKIIYTKYSEELKKALLQDDIKFLKVYGDNDACIEYKRIEYGHLTNADKIRAMTDEELANLMMHFSDYVPEPNRGTPEQCWLNWLKQEI